MIFVSQLYALFVKAIAHNLFINNMKCFSFEKMKNKNKKRMCSASFGGPYGNIIIF